MSHSPGCWIATTTRSPDSSDPWRNMVHETGSVDSPLHEQTLRWAAFLSSVPPDSPVLGLIDQHLGRFQQVIVPDIAPWGRPKQADWTRWAWNANAIWWSEEDCFLDPEGELLLDAMGTVASNAQVPFPVDARQRMLQSEIELRNRSVAPVTGVPPVPGLEEVKCRSQETIAQRALALFLVAVRAEAILGDHPLNVGQMRTKSPIGSEALSPLEKAFLDSQTPAQNLAETFVWRYETLATFQWALGIRAELKWPDERTDQADIVSPMLRVSDDLFLSETQLRSPEALLDALDQTMRLWWVASNVDATDSQPGPEALPGGIEAIIIAERMAALAWMCQWPPSILAIHAAKDATSSQSPHADWDNSVNMFVQSLFV